MRNDDPRPVGSEERSPRLSSADAGPAINEFSDGVRFRRNVGKASEINRESVGKHTLLLFLFPETYFAG